MNYDEMIHELMQRVGALEQEVANLMEVNSSMIIAMQEEGIEID